MIALLQQIPKIFSLRGPHSPSITKPPDFDRFPCIWGEFAHIVCSKQYLFCDVKIQFRVFQVPKSHPLCLNIRVYAFEIHWCNCTLYFFMKIFNCVFFLWYHMNTCIVCIANRVFYFHWPKLWAARLSKVIFFAVDVNINNWSYLLSTTTKKNCNCWWFVSEQKVPQIRHQI